ncbi:MAG: M28 family peptidase, partial [Ignavibacteriae bacterium]|nr:M28 family peptidase [Ignavibacteriota bacterium]
IITAHLQEEKSSANDDGSGCASILEIARTLNKLMQDGKIPRPLRDIRFWWTDEISSEYRYFKEHPDEPKKFLANIHQDMVGANQCMGSRVQHLIFAPYSRTSYLDAIFESIGNFVILTNNSFLAASRQGGLPRPFTRPIFSALGSHDGYNARFVPYFNSSDHMTFVEGIIGVPAIATINWDDPFIHSSGDDLYQIDQTQLKRNCFIMGSTAFVLAFLDDSKLATVAEETFAQGEKRLANDFLAAMRSLGESGVCESCDARIVIEQGIERETRALNSIRSLIQADWTSREKQYFNSYLDRLLVFMKQKKQGLLNTLSTLDSTHVRINDAVIISSPQDSLVRKKIPSNPISVKAYFENRDKVRAKTDLHPLMREEVYNFVDGKRSYYDIYKAVRAEQLAAGSWYYGNVTLQDVVNLLDAAVEAKALELKQ